MYSLKRIFSGSSKKAEQKTETPPSTQISDTASDPETHQMLDLNNVIIGYSAKDKEDVLRLVAKKMLDMGYVSDDYYQALADREQKVSTYLTNGVAIPHGAADAKHLVVNTGLIIVQIPEGIIWNDKGDKVFLVVAIAANGSQHLEILQRFTQIVMDPKLVTELTEQADAANIVSALTGRETAEKTVLPDFDIQTNVNITDQAGIHARPATLIAEIAQQFSDTTIHIRFKQHTVSAKSMAEILTLGAAFNAELCISAQGPQEKEAITALAVAITTGLDDDDCAQQNATYQSLNGLPPISSPTARLIIPGNSASSGIAMALPLLFAEANIVPESTPCDDPTAESTLLHEALEAAREQLEALYEQMKSVTPTEAAIFKAHLQILKDEGIQKQAFDNISSGQNAAWSWHHVLEQSIAKLSSVDDERIQARGADMEDVRNRVLSILISDGLQSTYPDRDFILIARDLSPSQTANLSNTNVKGICTELGGPNSHMAILARALGIPALVGIGNQLLNSVQDNETVIIDPQSSSLIVGPDQETMDQATQRITDWDNIQQQEREFRHEPAVTTDGHHVDVVCNIATPADSEKIVESGGEGVGLLRTEFLFENAKVEPDVVAQVKVLTQIAEHVGSRHLVIRTADIGGDKPVSWMSTDPEDNPFLGIRGIRLSFKHQDIFCRQLEAIYKTALWQQDQGIKSGIQIMFPMITTLNEWRKARELAEQVREKLDAPYLPLGIMVEVPAAAIQADQFAKEVDFFSIGSNDLTQYTLAMDRLHPELAGEADSYNPALLRLIAMTIKAANDNNKWVGLCGNMAAEPDLACILVGLGITELSVSPANAAAVKHLIRSVSFEKLQAQAQVALNLDTADAVRELYRDKSSLI